ncbi:MAG: alpha/beta fold hydrolase [Sphingobacteriales bacterium]
MKKLRQIIADVKTAIADTPDDLNDLLWQLICYSPKMPLRLQQEQLLNEAEKFSLPVKDEYFAQKELHFNGFIWGSGQRKILITHGWGSKAADFSELITALREVDDVQIIAFDAPGNGSSEGELSNLLLYKEAVKAIIQNYGTPDVLIGHSLGGMANVVALKELSVSPSLLVSLTPLIRLKENFEASMNAVGVPQAAQTKFLDDFKVKFNMPASHFNLNNWYPFDARLKHWLAYDKGDLISTYDYLEGFLNKYPFIENSEYPGTGHERILKSPQLIGDLMRLVKSNQ